MLIFTFKSILQFTRDKEIVKLKSMNKGLSITIPIFFITLLLYIPILIKPSILLERGDDLEEFFWPIFYFVKEQILQNHTFPLWNNLFLSGTPLLPDPQSPLFYLPNVIFLFLPLDLGFLLSFFGHTLLGGVGIYLLASNIFKFPKTISFFVAFLYILNPNLISHIEAGHYGLVASFGLMPWVVYSVFRIFQKPSSHILSVLALSLAGIYLTHLPTFAVTFSSSLILITVLLFKERRIESKKLIYLFVGFLLTLGLVSVVLIPQLQWRNFTTRELLLKFPDAYPKWDTKLEFIEATLFPWGKIDTLDTEKWIAIGLIPAFLAIWGFLKLKRRWQIIFLSLFISFIFILLNNLSPIFNFLISQQFYLEMRVSTRIWFVVYLMIIFLAGFGLKKLSGKDTLVVIIIILAVSELLSLAWLRMLKPIESQKTFPAEGYQFLQEDQGLYRVFCVTRCIPQKEAAIHNLELIEGYNTIQQINFYQQAWQLTGSYWNYYTLSIPPLGTYTFDKPQPDPVSLGAFNTKYIVSPYKLDNPNFILERKVDDYSIYRNNLWRERAYFWTDDQKPGPPAPVLIYTPNLIRIDTTSHPTDKLVLAEVYSPGWRAYLDGRKLVPVQEKPDTLRLVDIRPDTQFVDFKYQPKGFHYGGIITAITFIVLLTLLAKSWIKRSFSLIFK